MAMIRMFIPEQGSQNMFHKIIVVKAIIMTVIMTVIFVIFHIVILGNSVFFSFQVGALVEQWLCR